MKILINQKMIYHWYFPLSNMYVYIFYYSPSGSINIYNEKIKRIFPNSLCKKILKLKKGEL